MLSSQFTAVVCHMLAVSAQYRKNKPCTSRNAAPCIRSRHWGAGRYDNHPISMRHCVARSRLLQLRACTIHVMVSANRRIWIVHVATEHSKPTAGEKKVTAMLQYQRSWLAGQFFCPIVRREKGTSGK